MNPNCLMAARKCKICAIWSRKKLSRQNYEFEIETITMWRNVASNDSKIRLMIDLLIVIFEIKVVQTMNCKT